ncbi:hypothetical protein [Flavobacterium restrictum]|uniref:hypothetical protein n=1 Tax=Flavobacterium restrictum TaxID=2594428 RepID=UPI0011850428|nr:hypothetical protein [Flavobacterium restrictum]
MNIAVSVLPFLFGGTIAFNYCFLSVGLVVSFAVKEWNAKNEYLFYYNNQISKLELICYTWIMSFVALTMANILFHLTTRLF